MTGIMFDDALSLLVATLARLAGSDFVEAGIVLRDSSGRLGFVADRTPRDENERGELGHAVIEALGVYARSDRPVRFRGDGGAETLLSEPLALPVQIGETFCRLVDRRVVGAGWLDAPATGPVSPPRVVFAALKGGVGRSTALAVAAADLARANRNVLVVDLDLEAPGLGDLLLDSSRIPELGVIDYLVENGLGGVPDADMHHYIGTSELTSADGGRVDVFPALGRRSLSHPENILPKLARAMIEDVVDGSSISVAKQISMMISATTKSEQYDVVLIDSRAGLAELAAPAVLGLGATVLLFGTAQKQTVEGYRALFAALQLLAQRDRAQNRDTEWRTMLRPVYAKASAGNDVAEQFFIDEMFELYSAHIYDAEEPDDASAEFLRFVRDDKTAPHWPLIVPFNSAFIDFDPSRTPGQLTQSFYEQTFRPFLSELWSAINLTRAEEGLQ
ncbi:KGGVGR-motif variant AAA ATPase [Pseudochelatococcus lubricantis]|uniref:KGGVGR-motif variant AAA ATPase n=1 Tax=Pseudochelatococcus lubricantis TaxID=1538102 RepID=UPI0035ECFE0F